MVKQKLNPLKEILGSHLEFFVDNWRMFFIIYANNETVVECDECQLVEFLYITVSAAPFDSSKSDKWTEWQTNN